MPQRDLQLPDYPPMWVVIALSSIAPVCVVGLFLILGILLNIVALSDILGVLDFG